MTLGRAEASLGQTKAVAPLCAKVTNEALQARRIASCFRHPLFGQFCGCHISEWLSHESYKRGMVVGVLALMAILILKLGGTVLQSAGYAGEPLQKLKNPQLKLESKLPPR